jgi:hypothetical protein
LYFGTVGKSADNRPAHPGILLKAVGPRKKRHRRRLGVTREAKRDMSAHNRIAPFEKTLQSTTDRLIITTRKGAGREGSERSTVFGPRGEQRRGQLPSIGMREQHHGRRDGDLRGPVAT